MDEENNPTMKNNQLTAINTETKKEYAISWKDQTSGAINDNPFSVDIEKINDRTFHVIKDNKSYNVEILSAHPEEKNYHCFSSGSAKESKSSKGTPKTPKTPKSSEKKEEVKESVKEKKVKESSKNK